MKCDWQGCAAEVLPGHLRCDLHGGALKHRCYASGCTATAVDGDGNTQWCDKHAPDVIEQAPHYTQCKIQPIEFIRANNLNFCEGNVVKYVSRHRFKNGVEDLKKARRYLNWLIEEYESEQWTLLPTGGGKPPP